MEERLKTLEKHTNNIFLAGAIIGALSCFARADYNLPLYAFLYLLWDKDPVSMSDRLSFLLPESFLTIILVLEIEIPPHPPPGSDLGRRSLVALLLGASLAIRRDEKLATRSPQLRHFRLAH